MPIKRPALAPGEVRRRRCRDFAKRSGPPFAGVLWEGAAEADKARRERDFRGCDRRFALAVPDSGTVLRNELSPLGARRGRIRRPFPVLRNELPRAEPPSGDLRRLYSRLACGGRAGVVGFVEGFVEGALVAGAVADVESDDGEFGGVLEDDCSSTSRACCSRQ